MRAKFQSNRTDATTMLDLFARDDQDMERVNRVVSYLVNTLGYEEVAADHDHHIALGVYGHTIEELKSDYAEAKEATK